MTASTTYQEYSTYHILRGGCSGNCLQLPGCVHLWSEAAWLLFLLKQHATYTSITDKNYRIISGIVFKPQLIIIVPRCCCTQWSLTLNRDRRTISRVFLNHGTYKGNFSSVQSRALLPLQNHNFKNCVVYKIWNSRVSVLNSLL